MKFGDKVKLKDNLWTGLKDIISLDTCYNVLSLQNEFVCLKATKEANKDRIVVASLTEDLTKVCGGCNKSSWSKYFPEWSFWHNYSHINGSAASTKLPINEYFGDENNFPHNWKTIVPIETMVFIIYDGVLLIEKEKPLKQVQSGSSCLICKDYNPWMEPNSFCWSCNNDPRNKYKIEDIKESLAKMASI